MSNEMTGEMLISSSFQSLSSNIFSLFILSIVRSLLHPHSPSLRHTAPHTPHSRIGLDVKTNQTRVTNTKLDASPPLFRPCEAHGVGFLIVAFSVCSH